MIAVVGSGVMGAGIAQVAAAAGHTVKLYDVRAEAVDKAIQSIQKKAPTARVERAGDIRELAGSKLVIEAVVEDLSVKQRLFAELETVVDGDCILATNTSSLSITAIAAGLKRPARVVGMHFFNPAPVMELVEVISGLATDRNCAEAVYATAAQWGKTPVYAKSTPGFIVNRIARPYYGEALRLLSEGAASPASLDAIMRESGGFRMGPFALMDLIGNDVNFAVTRSVFEAYFGDPRFTPSLIQKELVEAGFLGRKSGRGFFEYGENAERGEPVTEPPAPPPKHANDVIILLTDGRTATQRAHETGIDDLVLVDLALDYGKAARVAVAKARQCSECAYRAAAGALQDAGYAVTPMRDLPGMAVMRTVAMLVNEAADAVNQGVCTVDAVNTAMRKGVNYPLGPLEWGDRIGIPKIHRVLINLAAHYGEDRYRVSPLIRELLWSGKKFENFENFND
ncbi:MAG: 3-hydroxyacyl-CoA dehydrogenase NAD-binding domain-containing protein [Bryobacteraceae bacterium]